MGSNTMEDPAVKTDRSNKQKNNEETKIIRTVDQVYQVDNNRTVHPEAVEYSLFSSVYGIYSRHARPLTKPQQIQKTLKSHCKYFLKLETNNLRNSIKY